MYNIYGKSYGRNVKRDEVILLQSIESRLEAISWARRYCGTENMGNWDVVFINSDDMTTIWSYYNEPMQWSDNAMEEF